MNNTTLKHGNCELLLTELQDNSVDCIVTDPPYKYLKHKLEVDYNEDLVTSEIARVCKKDGLIAVFGRGTSLYRLVLMLESKGFNFKEEIVWDKRRTSSPMTAISRKHELCVVMSKGKGKINKVRIPYLEEKQYDLKSFSEDIKRLRSALNDTNRLNDLVNFLETGNINYSYYTKAKHGIVHQGIKGCGVEQQLLKSITEGLQERSIITVPREHYKYKHPTQKPVRLMERIINLVSQEGDTVLDPFMGGGSTGVAAINTNRKFIGFELDEEYYNTAKERINEANQKLF